MEDDSKVTRILMIVMVLLGVVYILGIAYQRMRSRYNENAAQDESLVSSVEASIADEEKQMRQESIQQESIQQTFETVVVEEANPVTETAESIQAGTSKDVIIPQSVVQAAHDFTYEISTDLIPDTYQTVDTTYTLSSYNLYGYENGRDKWEALFKEKNVVYTFTGYIDVKLKLVPHVDTLAKELGLECSGGYKLAEQEFDAEGNRRKEYVYMLDDEMQKGELRYGYEFDYNSKGQRTEYRYYYNSYKTGWGLSSRIIYEYGEDGLCESYREYTGDGMLKKTCQYARDASGKRQQRLSYDTKGDLTDTEEIYYDDLGAICKTVTLKKVTLYINDDTGNPIVKAVYEKE